MATKPPPKLNQSLTSYQIRQSGNALKYERMKQFFYNPIKKELFGRTLQNWARGIIYHTVLYFGMVAFFVICLGLFSVTIDEIYPTRQNTDSALGGSPGMGYRPVMDHESNLIRFIQGKPGTYKGHTDSIQGFLDQYEKDKQVGENFVQCETGRPPDAGDDKVCYFNLDQLGDDCTWQNDYGYDEGKPCVALKLNKIYGWRPEPYEKPDDLPISIHDNFSPKHMPVICEGEGPLDHENIGNITYLPKEGFPIWYYPYLNQEGYRSPLVIVKFVTITNGMVVNIICKTYAKNIKQDRNDQIGSVRFTILVD